jgi:hypothetical protein
MRRVASILAGFALAASFYMLLIDTVDLPELYAMLGVSGLAAAAFEVSRERDVAAMSFDRHWFVRAWRPLAAIPRQIGLVSWEAVKQLIAPRRRRGAFRAIPFAMGGPERGDGRVAAAEGFGSLAPNTIVVGVDPETELLLVHQLRAGGGREELDVLGIG